MGSLDNRFRKKWQDYSGTNATIAEHSFIEVFNRLFADTEYKVISKPKYFNKIYVDVRLSKKEIEEIYNPPVTINKHGIQPDGAILNTRTGKTIFIEIKRQDGWVEGKKTFCGQRKCS